ncbi:MAG: hypothetical protein M0Q21_04260 [Ignavibacteriaceae bacterium]|nr:hypothetical protein [Ignavibacteriaceae bacterium]
MKQKQLFVLLLLFFFFSPLAFSQSVDELIKEGDDYSMREFNNQKALETFQKAEKLEADNPEVLWRISRSYVDIAEHMPSSSDDQKDAQLVKYQLAADYAEKAVKAAPNASIGYLRRAIAKGRIALFKGVFKVIGLVNDVKKDCEKAIKLGNGGNDIQASSHYVLGRSHAKVCEKPYLVRLPLGLGWGDMDISFAEYKKAIELRPNFRMYHLDYAKALIEEDEYQKAKEELYKIPYVKEVDEDDDLYLVESKKLLETIKNK